MFGGKFPAHHAAWVNGGMVCQALGRRFELMNLSYKPYLCCRDVRTAVDAVLQLRTKASHPASDIESIRVGVTAPDYQLVCVPKHLRLAPSTIIEAQFSIPYTVAASWIDGSLGMSHFSDEDLQRTDMLNLTSRVQPDVDAEIDRDWRRLVTPAKVTVQFRDGQTVEARIDYPKGHPRYLMTESEFAAKRVDCTTFAAKPVPSDTADRLISTVGKLESLPDIAEILRMVT